MKKETIEKLSKLQYRISRLRNLISAFQSFSPYRDVSMNKEDEEYIINYCGAKIEELEKEIDEL